MYDSIDIGILNWLRSLCAIQSKMSFASRNAPLASLAKASLKLISLVRFRSQLDRAESITVVTIDCSPYFYSIEPPIGVVYRSQSRKVSCGRQATTHGRILPCVCTSKYEYMHICICIYVCVRNVERMMGCQTKYDFFSQLGHAGRNLLSALVAYSVFKGGMIPVPFITPKVNATEWDRKHNTRED